MASAAEKEAAKAAKAAEKEAAKAATESVGEVIFVNREKLARAREIIILVSGKRAPINESEADQKDRFAQHFASNDVDPKSKDALRFVYENLLGGLVRSPEEQQEADENAAEQRAKHKKNKVGEKSGN